MNSTINMNGAPGSGYTVLDLSHNQLTTVYTSNFNFKPSLNTSKLYLNNNQITQITNGPITFSAKNHTLDLSFNKFTSFDGGWISVTSGSGQSDSGNITLSYNQITTITNPPLTTPKAGNGTPTFIISRVRTRKINHLN